jgi:hypothetical protein
MDKKLTIAIPLLALLVLGLLGQTLAQTRAPGVKAGDEFTFDVTTHWSSNNSWLTIPDNLLDINNTLWYKVSVSDVTQFNVTATNILHFVNQTEASSLVIVNTDTGSTNNVKGYQGFVNANLSAYDLIHPSGEDLTRINQTISRDYTGGKRDTNVVKFSFPSVDTDINLTIGTENVSYYFDKATGVLVELFIETEYFSPAETSSTTLMLKETNLWTVSTPQQEESPWPLLIIVAIVAVIIVAIVAVLYFRARKKSKKKFQR